MKNESNGDRIVRVVIGVILFLVATQFSGVIATVLYVLAFVSAVTAITGFCLLYKLLGISTLKK